MNSASVYIKSCERVSIEPHEGVLKVLSSPTPKRFAAVVFYGTSVEFARRPLQAEDFQPIFDTFITVGIRRRVEFHSFHFTHSLALSICQTTAAAAVRGALSEVVFSGCNITIEALRVILDSIDHLTGVGITHCELGPAGAALLASAISGRASLADPFTYLDISSTDQSTESMHDFLLQLELAGAFPARLLLGHNRQVHPAALAPLWRAVLAGTLFTEIGVGGISLGDEGVTELARALAACVARGAVTGRLGLRVLRLEACGITFAGAAAIGGLLTAVGPALQLQLLVLDGNPLRDRGVVVLAKALMAMQRPELVISMRRCGICAEGMNVLAHLVMAPTGPLLQGLLLAGNHMLQRTPNSQSISRESNEETPEDKWSQILKDRSRLRCDLLGFVSATGDRVVCDPPPENQVKDPADFCEGLVL